MISTQELKMSEINSSQYCLGLIHENINLNPLMLLNSIASFSESKISVDCDAAYIGKSVTVCTNVYGVKELDKVNFLNLGKSFPNSPLTDSSY
jgi:hypothetical protein